MTMIEGIRKPKRVFTPEQKYEIVKDIERGSSLKAGLEKHGIAHGLYYKWSRQLAVGVRSSLRNGRAVKSDELRRLERENRKLKEIVLNQSLAITELKKEMGLD